MVMLWLCRNRNDSCYLLAALLVLLFSSITRIISVGKMLSTIVEGMSIRFLFNCIIYSI